MRNFLIIAWIIIFGGLGFIAYKKFIPTEQGSTIIIPTDDSENILPSTEDSSDTTSENTSETTSTYNPIAEQPPAIVTAKSFEDHVAAGDQYLHDLLPASAIQEYKAALELQPTDLPTNIKLAEAYLENGESATAEQEFLKVSALNPESQNLKLGIARALLNQRQIKKAKEVVWQLDMTNYNVKYYAGVILILSKEFDEAKKLFTEIATTAPESYKILKQKTAKFIEKYDTFGLYAEGDPLFLQTMLAKALVDNREYQSAIPLLFDVLNQKSNYRDAWTILGYSYLQIKNSKEAIDALSQARSLDPENPTVLFYLGMGYYSNNQISKAIDYIEEAGAKGFEPKSQINSKLGELYLIRSNFSKAESNYSELLNANNNNIELYTKIVWLNIDKLKNPEKALQYAKLAIANLPEKAMSYNLTGWAYSAMKDNTNAEKNYQLALKIDPSIDSTYYNLGRLYEENGSTAISKQYYQKAYTLSSNKELKEMALSHYNKLNTKETSIDLEPLELTP